MGNKKISQLANGNTLDGTELVPIVQGGVTLKATTQEIADLAGAGSIDVNTLGAVINGATSATPNDTDLVMSVESSVAKKNTWTQIKAFLKTYFDTVYTTTSAVASQITTALTPYLKRQPLTTSITTSAAPTPNSDNTDEYIITALAEAATFGAPTGTPLDGQTLLIRVKDNGTARALGFNAAYRFSTDLPAPTTTVISKTLYLAFVYNATDSKWDCIGVLNNF